VSARRCSGCSIHWPDSYADYSVCPGCGEKTDSLGNAKPDDLSQARHTAFEVYFKAWDGDQEERRKAAEVKRLADLEAAVEAAPSIPDPPGAIGLERLPEPAKADEPPKGS
jgi:hypothetical protein